MDSQGSNKPTDFPLQRGNKQRYVKVQTAVMFTSEFVKPDQKYKHSWESRHQTSWWQVSSWIKTRAGLHSPPSHSRGHQSKRLAHLLQAHAKGIMQYDGTIPWNSCVFLKRGIQEIPHTGWNMQQHGANVLGELEHSSAEAIASRVRRWGGNPSYLWSAISKGSFSSLNIAPEQVSLLFPIQVHSLPFEWRHLWS